MSAPAIGLRPRWAPGPSAVIDWSHPLAQGLRHCIRPIGAKVVDLVTGRDLTVDTAATTGVTQFGRALRSSGAATGAYLPLTSAPPYPLSFTWVGDADCTAATSGAGLLAFAYGTSGGWSTSPVPYIYGLDYGGGSLTGPPVSGSAFVGGLFTTTSRMTGVASATMVTGSARLYVNGLLVASTTPSLTDPTSTNFVGLGFNRYSEATRSQSATGSLGLVHSRVLSANEVAALAADPFQIFRQ